MKLLANESAIEYVIKHDPIRYVVKVKWRVLYRIETLEGYVVYTWSLNSWYVKDMCRFLNQIYSLGYSTGVTSVLRTMKEF